MISKIDKLTIKIKEEQSLQEEYQIKIKQSKETIRRIQKEIQEEKDNIALYFGKKVSKEYPLSTKQSADQLFKRFQQVMENSLLDSEYDKTKENSDDLFFL